MQFFFSWNFLKVTMCKTKPSLITITCTTSMHFFFRKDNELAFFLNLDALRKKKTVKLLTAHLLYSQ